MRERPTTDRCRATWKTNSEATCDAETLPSRFGRATTSDARDFSDCGLRPAFAVARFRFLPDGNLACGVNKPGRGGQAKHRVMTPVECLARISALIPPPRYPLTRFHGVLAPRHKLRRLVAAATSRKNQDVRPCGFARVARGKRQAHGCDHARRAARAGNARRFRPCALRSNRERHPWTERAFCFAHGETTRRPLVRRFVPHPVGHPACSHL